MAERMRPTEPGWYWMKAPGLVPHIVELVWQTDENSRLEIWQRLGDDGFVTEIPLGADFRGPVPNLFEFGEPATKATRGGFDKELTFDELVEAVKGIRFEGINA